MAQTTKKEKPLEKKTSMTKKPSPLGLQTETPRRLDDSQMQGVVGGARLWRPTVADDTTPLYDGNG